MTALAFAPAAGPDFIQHRVHLPDGRRLLCAEYGERGELPIIYLHGFIGSRFEPRAAGDLGANIIALDRPGYGGSMPMPEPSLRRFGRDLVVLLDRLEVDRCGLVGVSAGGPYALAGALTLGARATGLVLAGAVADAATIHRAGGTVQMFGRFRRHRRLVATLLPRIVRQARHHGLDLQFVRLLLRDEIARLTEEADRAQVTRCLLSSLREGLRPGLDGVLGDIDVLTRPWDINPAELDLPVLVLHGAADSVVPPRHAVWYGDHLRNATVDIVAAHGHISLVVNEARRIADTLQRGRPRP